MGVTGNTARLWPVIRGFDSRYPELKAGGAACSGNVPVVNGHSNPKGAQPRPLRRG